jgi:hypothetical protein
MRSIEMNPGQEFEYTIELDMGRSAMSQDWSVTAWGEDGVVQVTVDDMSTAAFPYVKHDDTQLPMDEGGKESDNPNDAKATAAAKAAEVHRDEAKDQLVFVTNAMDVINAKMNEIYDHVDKTNTILIDA